jgi:glyoxylase-like metal-dependent hydrolase (beta-lactamase superfamily II)
MIGKLNDLLVLLPADIQLLPGHGRATTLARVKEVNPFLKSGR